MWKVMVFGPIGLGMYIVGRIISKRKRSDILLVNIILVIIILLSINSLIGIEDKLIISWIALFFSLFVLIFINFQKKFLK